MNYPDSLPTDSETPVTPAPEPSASESSFGDILTQFEESHRQEGERRQGAVVTVSDDNIVVDIGLKTEGVIPAEEFRDPSGKMDVAVGDRVVVSVKGRSPEGYYMLSKIKVERPKDWSGLEKAFAEKTAIAGVVSGAVKGGLSVDVGVRAFMPASRSGVRNPAELEQLVGQEITCRVIKLDTQKEDVVVDRRAVLEEQEKKKKQEFFESILEGAVATGTVRTLTDFGAFLDLGGVDGLLHVSDISHGRITKPADVLKVGDSLEVKVLKIDPNTRRISLGLKQLQPDPWSLVEEKYRQGERVKGKVARVVDFGAFIELEPGIEGLIHISDLSWSKKGVKPKDVVKPGEMVEVVVLNVKSSDRRVSLGLKQALGDPWDEAVQAHPVGSTVEGKVVSLAKFGAFVEVAEGVEGMIHVGDLSNEKRIDHPQDVLKMGEVVKALVLEIDRDRRRMRLGIKQLQPTSADEYIGEHKVGDVVTGRLMDVGRNDARVELGDGVVALCLMPKESKKSSQAQAAAEPADVGTLSAMLAAKWKQGKAPASFREPAKAGQVRTFRITSIDPASKRIEVELAS
ncbi:MAG TPA: 30S ribosomal protein S1 [Bryobacteraceae bacterium]|nr:30S ribosomal protein S1 [Bryobacteraceae bacterium]